MARNINWAWRDLHSKEHNWDGYQADTHHAHGNPHGRKLGFTVDDAIDMHFLYAVKRWSYNQIAQEYGCHSNTVRRWVRQAAPHLHTLKDDNGLEDIEAAHKLYRQRHPHHT